MEVAIAFAVLSLGFAAALPAAMGGRSLLAETSTRADALEAARQTLDAARAEAALDFRSVNSASATSGLFRLATDVQPDGLWTKRVTSDVSWRMPSSRISSVRLSTLLTARDPEDTCVSVPTGDWKHPHADTFDLAALVGDASGTYAITGLDAYRGKLYLTTSDGTSTKPTFFVLDVSDPTRPAVAGALDNDPAVKIGPNALAVAPTGDRVYAYLANASSFARGQLQVVDVTNPQASGWAPPFVTYKIPASAVPSAGVGNSLAYRRGYVYLGLTSAPGGDEFDVIDARDPLHPVWKGGYALQGHAANEIRLRGDYAYLAHPAGSASGTKEQLTVLNIAEVSAPRRVSGFWSAGGIGGNGKSVAAVGGTIWLGRTASRISGASDAIPELLALDGRDPQNVPSNPLGTISLDTAESANGIVVRDRLVFLLTNTRLQAWDVSDPAAPKPWSEVLLPSKGAAIDCEGNTLYVGSNSDTGNGSISIVTPQP